MNTVTTSYKHNGVPVSIPRGSYGVTRLAARLYEYPKGHPCRGCPFTLRTSVPSCMFPSRKDGGCLWYDLKRKKRPPLPHTYPRSQAAAERILISLKFSKGDETKGLLVKRRFAGCGAKQIFTGCSLNSSPERALM